MQVGLGNNNSSLSPVIRKEESLIQQGGSLAAPVPPEERFVSQLGAELQLPVSQGQAAAESVPTGELKPAPSPLHPSVQSLVKGLRDSSHDNPDPLLPSLASVLENAFSNGQPMKVTGERQLPADLMCRNGKDQVKVQLLSENRIRLSMTVDPKEQACNRESYENLKLESMDLLSLDDSFHAIVVDLKQSPVEVNQVAFLKNELLGNIGGEWFADTSICQPAKGSEAFRARMRDALDHYQPAQISPGLDLGNLL